MLSARNGHGFGAQAARIGHSARQTGRRFVDGAGVPEPRIGVGSERSGYAYTAIWRPALTGGPHGAGAIGEGRPPDDSTSPRRGGEGAAAPEEFPSEPSSNAQDRPTAGHGPGEQVHSRRVRDPAAELCAPGASSPDVGRVETARLPSGACRPVRRQPACGVGLGAPHAVGGANGFWRCAGEAAVPEPREATRFDGSRTRSREAHGGEVGAEAAGHREAGGDPRDQERRSARRSGPRAERAVRAATGNSALRPAFGQARDLHRRRGRDQGGQRLRASMPGAYRGGLPACA